jgi:alkylhydroperoxidase/carboxymuconolactone decarboxylase family protein YurZ
MVLTKISNEIGGGEIRADVQEAIACELDARLAGVLSQRSKQLGCALARKDKELILMALACLQQRTFIAELHARTVIMAGGTLDEVVEIAALTIISGGMPQFKRAGLPAIRAAETLVGTAAGKPREKFHVPRSTDRMQEIRDYVRRTLNVEWPDMFAKLEMAAPYALDGYMRIRQGLLDENGAASKDLKELVMTAMDLLLGNSWGAPLHGRQAKLDGATDQQLVETVALAVIECGAHVYLAGGADVVRLTADPATQPANNKEPPPARS